MAASGLLSTLTKEQRAIMEAATLGHNIFITGAAGTGKSFVVKNLIKAFYLKTLFYYFIWEITNRANNFARRVYVTSKRQPTTAEEKINIFCLTAVITNMKDLL